MLQSNLLQTDRTHLQLSGYTQPDQINGGGIGDLVKYAIAFLRRRYLMIIVTGALVFAATTLYLRFAPPTYTAEVQILLKNPQSKFVQQQSLLPEPVIDNAQIETQLQMIRSRAIAAAVLTQLKLANDPEFTGSSQPFGSLLQRIRNRGLGPENDSEAETSNQPSEGAIVALLDRLSASRVGYSNIVEVSYSSSSATRAAEIANSVANAYINDQMNARFEAARTAASWLQERLTNLNEQALTAERAVSAYKSQNNMVFTGGKSIDEQPVNDLNARLVAARTQTSDALVKFTRYDAILRANATGSSTISAPDAASADVLQSPIINSLRQQYLELSRREGDWSARFGRDHLAVINLRTRIRDIRTSIIEEVTRLAETSRNELEAARQRQKELEKQLAEAISQSRMTNSAELTIRELEIRAKGLRAMHEAFQQHYMGSAQETFPTPETRVIFPASPPERKSKPKTKLMLGVGLVAGLALGIGLALLRDVMDRVFRTSSQLEAALELPCLSLVPVLSARKTPKSRIPPQQQTEDLRSRTLANVPTIHRAVIEMPLSRFTEAIRSIKLAIDHSPAKVSNQVIGITSALPNEGKTTIAASLAQLIGHGGKRVIIVDCDLRNPSLSASLAPEATFGLLEVVNGSRSLEDAIWRDPKTNLAFLPIVRRGVLFHTSEILSADNVSTLFDRLRQTYDYIIVDLPPLSPLVDVRVTASLIDCYVLVVEWGRTKIDVVQHALHTAPTICDSVIGAVLNKTDMRSMARYDTSRSDYYNDSHYIRYGLSES